MKKLLPILLGATAVFTHSALAQTATTTPVGAVTVKLDANKKTSISIPLEKSAVFLGAATAVSSNTITDSAANFGAYANTHYVKITSGNAAGRNLRILSNTTNVLTVQTGTGSWALPVDSSSANSVNVVAGDKYQIVPMWTLGDVFGTNLATCVLKTAANPNNADQFTVYSDGVQATYFNNGTNWRNAISPSDTTNYNSYGLLPTAGLWILRRSSGVNAELQFTGDVPTIAARYEMPGGASFGQAIPLPSGAKLDNLGFASSPTWVKNNNPNNADQVTVYRPDNTQNTFFVNALGLWKNAISPSDTTNYGPVEIQSGSGLWVKRKGSASGPAANFASTLPYSLN